MDPNLKPDPEHTGWLWGAGGALIVYLSGKLTELVGYIVRRKDAKEDKTAELLYNFEEALHKHALANAQTSAELETRLRLLESQKVVTIDALKVAITEALKEARLDYGQQHGKLEERVTECASDINKRIDKLVKILPAHLKELDI